MSRRLGVVALLAYALCIYGANWSIHRYGFVSVGFGLTAPAGVYFAGAVFVLRDVVQMSLGRWFVLPAIVAGALLSMLTSTSLALASGTAFLVGELLEWTVYTPIAERGHVVGAVALADSVGLLVDTFLFLWLAFGAIAHWQGLALGKAYMTALRADRCLFAVVPDRYDPNDLAGNHAATLERWHLYCDDVLERGLPPAFVCQNGCTPDDIPPEAEAVFIGGDTEWKLSERAWACVAASKARGKWVHLGRANGLPRVRAASISNVDSCDGNLLRHGYAANIHRLLAWLDHTEAPSLPLFGGNT